MDYSLPGSSVHGILQIRILEWITIPFSRGSSDPGMEAGSPALQADSTIRATRDAIPNWQRDTEGSLNSRAWWDTWCDAEHMKINEILSLSTGRPKILFLIVYFLVFRKRGEFKAVKAQQII